MPETDATLPTADLLMELRLRAEALERQLAEVQRQTETRIIHAELKAEAVRAGIVDADGLKLIDLSAARLNDAGEVEGAAALVADLKRSKPWLFGGSVSTSSAAAPPPAQPPRQKSAVEMTEDEWRAARAALLQRRR